MKKILLLLIIVFSTVVVHGQPQPNPAPTTTTTTSAAPTPSTTAVISTTTTHLDNIQNSNDQSSMGQSSNANNSSCTGLTKQSTPLNFLIMLVLGAILGATGQGVRVIVGLKKASDSNDGFDKKQLLTSLLIALVIGGIAGVLAAMKTTDFCNFTMSDAMLFIGAGYAGTDFIEGFMNTNSGQATPPTPNPPQTNAIPPNKIFPSPPTGTSTAPVIDGSKLNPNPPTNPPSHIN